MKVDKITSPTATTLFTHITLKEGGECQYLEVVGVRAQHKRAVRWALKSLEQYDPTAIWINDSVTLLELIARVVDPDFATSIRLWSDSHEVRCASSEMGRWTYFVYQ